MLMMVSVLLSGVGFTVDQHYCMGSLQSERFYGEAETCVPNGSCALPSGEQGFTPVHCCEDKQLLVPGLQISSFDLKKQNYIPDFETIDQNSFTPGYSELSHSSSEHPLRAPPEINFNGRVLLIKVQRFLI